MSAITRSQTAPPPATVDGEPPARLPAAVQCGSCSAADWARPAAEPLSPDLSWPEFATPAILALLTGEERKPLRAACRAGRDAVDAGITRLEMGHLSNWEGGQGAEPWSGVPLGAVRLPALRHLNVDSGGDDSDWEQHGAAHMRGAARLVAAHAASLRTLCLRFWIISHPESHLELAALEVGFLESVLLAAPLPALQRLELLVSCSRDEEARWMEALRPLARLSLPRLTRLSIWAGAATGQGVRWLEGAHLPALRHLAVADYSNSGPDHPCVAALAAPRWSSLEALELHFDVSGSSSAALSAALAPTLRRLVVRSWPFGTEGCAEEWPQLRSLELEASGTPAEQLGPVRLPRLERLAVFEEDSVSAFLEGFAALRRNLPALRALELRPCVCDNNDCPIVGCTDPRTVALLAELRAAWPGLELRRWREEARDATT
jgi:hypothetical protein